MGTEWTWTREPQPARWDNNKSRIIGRAGDGVFGEHRYHDLKDGDLVGGSWWRVEDPSANGGKGQVIAYGWMDVNWGDAEILLATDRDYRQQGIGTFVMERLKREALARGLRYLTNVVYPTHPEKERLSAWLEKRGFASDAVGRYFRALTSAA